MGQRHFFSKFNHYKFGALVFLDHHLGHVGIVTE